MLPSVLFGERLLLVTCDARRNWFLRLTTVVQQTYINDGSTNIRFVSHLQINCVDVFLFLTTVSRIIINVPVQMIFHFILRCVLKMKFIINLLTASEYENIIRFRGKTTFILYLLLINKLNITPQMKNVLKLQLIFCFWYHKKSKYSDLGESLCKVSP